VSKPHSVWCNCPVCQTRRYELKLAEKITAELIEARKERDDAVAQAVENSVDE
jgi:hypothetical protein